MTTNELTLRFQRLPKEADFDAPVPVSVKFGENETEAFPFTNPLSDKDLGQIRWYLEKYYDWPTDIDDERARGIAGQLPQWGQALFNAVFQQSANAMRLFDRFNESRQADAVLTIDTTEPRILRLPWELLRDEGGYLFGKTHPSPSGARCRLTSRPIQPFELPVRILMVTCRPDGAGFIDPRSIAGPLLDALQEIPEQVEVEFLRPPTLNALDARLRDPHQPRVHIVHFDGHGVFDKTIGLGFLLFEDEKQEMDRVDAERLGTLLNESGVPLMVLNACQSGQPDERNPLASVASRLIESGVGGVVAMNYSVLVETARRFTTHFYGELARGHSAATALDAARRRLFADTRRLTVRVGELGNKEKTLHLQDWFLPALYQQEREIRPFPVAVSPHPPVAASPTPPLAPSPNQRAQFPPAPLHGFHGRARELLALERAFAKRHILILHGFGGQGKTALATQTADWFQRTGLFRQAAFVSFETGVGLDFVLNELGNALVGDNFQIYDGDKVEAIANTLRQTATLLVWDNFESVLPGGNAPLPTEELQRLLDAGARWAVNGSRLLVTSRNAEIPHTAFMPGVNCQRKELTGLALSDALELAGAILEAHSLPPPRRDPLEELLKFLGGHPLSLQLALPHLAHHTPTQLMVRFKELLPTIQVGEAKERNESLAVSLRFSLDRLGVEAQSWLTRLAVFEGGAWEPRLLQITEIPEATWHALKPQLITTALIRAEELPGVTVPYIHFHPTLAPYLRAQQSEIVNRQSEIVNRYWQDYYQLANYLYSNDKHNPIPSAPLPPANCLTCAAPCASACPPTPWMRRWILPTPSASF
ncbi:MAG: CHAT domain-containing protein [Chloroflexi bacterium]|nr:CHAT domain-containing protein [Chloroflexota bacterium]